MKNTFPIVFFILTLPLLQGLDHAESSGYGLFEAGDYTQAASQFLKDAGRKGMKVQSYYNAARSFHQDFLDNGNHHSLDRAVSGYYRILDLDPAHRETLVNLELARREQEKLENESSQEKQDGPGDPNSQNSQEDQQSGDSLSELAQKQKELSRSEDDTSEQQKSLTEQTENALNQQENQEIRKALEEALEEQEKAQDQLNRNRPDEAREAQEAAASALEQAAGLAEEPQDDKNQIPEDLQSLLNQEQSRNEQKYNPEDMIQVERNW